MLGGGIYPGMITATVGTGLLIAVVLSSIVIARRRLRYEAWYTRPPDGLRSDRARVVPPDSDRQRARPRPHRRRLLARADPRHLRPTPRLPGAGPGRERLPLPDEGRRGDSRRAGGHLAADRRTSTRSPGRPTGPVLPLAVPRPQPLVGFASFFALRDLLRRGFLSDHRQGARRLLGRGYPTLRPEHALSPKGRSVSSPKLPAVARRSFLIAGGIGITPIRALMEDMSGDVVVIYRVVREEDVIFREELETLALERGIALFSRRRRSRHRRGRAAAVLGSLAGPRPGPHRTRGVRVRAAGARPSSSSGTFAAHSVPSNLVHVEKFAL